jgi:hypothetical protein
MRGASAKQTQAGQTHRASDAPQRHKTRKAAIGDDAGTRPSPATASPQAVESSAGDRLADGCSAHAAASGSAAPGAAAHCEEPRRNCCNDPEARFPRAANGLAPDNPDSNTARSNRADIAFVCLANPRLRRRKGERYRRSAPTAKTPRTGGIVRRRV